MTCPGHAAVPSTAENLALACPGCNLHKPDPVSAPAPESSKETPLFHPRRDTWRKHFRWEAERIVGKTTEGVPRSPFFTHDSDEGGEGDGLACNPGWRQLCGVRLAALLYIDAVRVSGKRQPGRVRGEILEAMIAEFLETVAVTFAGLFPIVNPISTAVVFVSITDRFSAAKKKQQAGWASIYMAAILLVFMTAGAVIMSFFGISLPAMRIAGGLIIARIGFGMLNPEPERPVSEEAENVAHEKRDIAFTPLAMPMLSGPGSIAVTITMATIADRFLDYVAIGVGILLVALSAWLVLRASTHVIGFLGAAGTEALSRIMGFMLVCIGVQFIGLAVIEIAANEEVLRAIVSGLRKATVE